MRALKISVVVVALGAFFIAGSARTQQKQMSDADYVKAATSAGPAGIAKDAAVIRVDDSGKMTTVREGKNDFTCMVMGTNKMCNDKNSMEFIHAMLTHTNPPDKLGISYMLAGDDGASNTDPYARTKTADNHWVVTGPHIMVMGPGAKTMGFPKDANADPTKPYMMWAGTPYEHAMIPVSKK